MIGQGTWLKDMLEQVTFSSGGRIVKARVAKCWVGTWGEGGVVSGGK